jgi:hypothetical protein
MATSADPPSGGVEWHPVAPVAGPPAKLRPGRVWYWMALGVFLAGVAWVVVGFVVLVGRVDSFQRVPIPGTGVISLERGGYVIYYEGPGASSGAYPAFHFNARPVPGSGARPHSVTVTLYSGSLTYHFGSHEGIALFSLQAARPGRFLYRGTSSPAVPGSHLAFGSSIAGWIAVIAVPAVVLVLAGIAGAIVVAIIRHIRAKRARVPQPLS